MSKNVSSCYYYRKIKIDSEEDSNQGQNVKKEVFYSFDTGRNETDHLYYY